MSEIKTTIDRLLTIFGTTGTVYKYQGSEPEDSDEFWHEDQGWADEGTEYKILFEQPISEEVQERGGIKEEDIRGDVEIWFKEEAVENGDKIEVYGKEWVVLDEWTFHMRSEEIHQVATVRRE